MEGRFEYAATRCFIGSMRNGVFLLLLLMDGNGGLETMILLASSGHRSSRLTDMVLCGERLSAV